MTHRLAGMGNWKLETAVENLSDSAAARFSLGYHPVLPRDGFSARSNGRVFDLPRAKRVTWCYPEKFDPDRANRGEPNDLPLKIPCLWPGRTLDDVFSAG